MGWRWWPGHRGAGDLPEGWEEVIGARLRQWRLLDADEQERLVGLVQHLLREKSWEAARGFRLTDEIRLTIAAHACLPVLELGLDWYHKVRSIVVHPRTLTLTGQRQGPVSGVMTDSPLPVQGHAQGERWPIVIAWDAARRDARHPERGQDVVIHEFAHKLDMLDGVLDGTPPMTDSAARQRFADVCTGEFEALREGTGGHLVREYGGTNPGEFFAVVSELFFTRPLDLHDEKPALYEVLQSFYRQDPAARVSG
jgi:MtfA peptidase